MLRYAITPGELSVRPGEGEIAALVARSIEVARAGADLLLIREKALGAGDLTRVSRRVVSTLGETGLKTKVLVARRPDVAAAAGAHGVHLSSAAGELSAAQVQEFFALAGVQRRFVSVSCHGLDEVQRARNGGASAVLFAPVFGKRVGGQEVAVGLGLEALRQACEAAGEMRVFALGGVTEENAAECVRAGAAGVAGIRMFFAPVSERHPR